MGVLLVISIVASLIIIMIGTGMLIFTLIPVTDSKLFKESYINTKSKIHFDSISNYNSFKEYKDKFSHIRRQDYINDLISQVYINSSIASRKYKAYKTGVITSCIGFTVFLILSVIGYVIVNKLSGQISSVATVTSTSRSIVFCILLFQCLQPS